MPSPAFQPDSTVPLWIHGKQRTTSETFDVTSPTTGKLLWKASSASSEDVSDAITSAEQAFQTWRWSKPKQRRDIFLRAHQILVERRDTSLRYSNAETGVPEVMFGFEYGTALDILLQLAGLAGGADTAGFVVDPDDEDRSSMVIRQPYGVVLGIAPWNAPHTLGLRSCLFPLAAGNTVILKGPELAPATFWHFVSALHEAGLPAGCLNTIYHRPSDAAAVTEQIVSHPAVRKINFTGSTYVGSVIASLCGEHIKPCVLELGGKGAAIVCEDADVELAAEQCALGAFSHAGQVCMSTERIFVQRNIYGQFKEALKSGIDNVFSLSSPAPTLINHTGVEKNRKLIEDALAKGANTVHGSLPSSQNGVNHNDSMPTTNRMRPIVVEAITKDMQIYQTESFGPTVSLYQFDNDEEVLKLANDTPYGLSAAVFTENLRRAMKMAKRIESGAVHINSMTIHDEVGLPHGGVKDSGFGRFNGRDGLEEWLRTKSITWKD